MQCTIWWRNNFRSGWRTDFIGTCKKKYCSMHRLGCLSHPRFKPECEYRRCSLRSSDFERRRIPCANHWKRTGIRFSPEKLLTLGISQPSRNGYIQIDEPTGDFYKVKHSPKKPELELAQSIRRERWILWNSIIYVERQYIIKSCRNPAWISIQTGTGKISMLQIKRKHSLKKTSRMSQCIHWLRHHGKNGQMYVS